MCFSNDVVAFPNDVERKTKVVMRSDTVELAEKTNVTSHDIGMKNR